MARCEACGLEAEPVPVLYGMPDNEAMAQAERGELVLGGCVVQGDPPAFRCVRCGEPAAGSEDRQSHADA